MSGCGISKDKKINVADGLFNSPTPRSWGFEFSSNGNVGEVDGGRFANKLPKDSTIGNK